MASDDVEVGHNADIASQDRCDTRPQSVLSRPPSMTSVRLSDPSDLSTIHTASPDSSASPGSSGQSVRASHSTAAVNHTIEAHGDEDAIDETFEATSTTDENRDSSMSIASYQEEDSLASASSTVRSRSDSSATQSSSGSAQVDWDELEKSEEQAPRDEGSDEVHLPKLTISITH